MLTPTRSHIRRFIVSGLLFSKAQTAATPPSSSALLDSLPVQEIAGVRVVDTPTAGAGRGTIRPAAQHRLVIQARRALDAFRHAHHPAQRDPGVHRRPGNARRSRAAARPRVGPATELTFISGDRRFEVDGAFAARAFLEAHEEGRRWQDDGRMQLVWDSIALHTERSIAYYKEPVVQVVSEGIGLDFSGPGLGVTEAEYAAVVDRFPKDGLRGGVNDTLVWLCETKPATTYGEFRAFLRVAPPPSSQKVAALLANGAFYDHLDTWMQPWDDRYVAKYSAEGHQRIDLIFANLTSN
ncbi:hypothetical protein DL766_003553 [Monosporascus sp. MC13-8B]|uniref:Uncharacterized protein n=1 Tax=Monosporascus cannonballus TaxID=155416 RepID=A0ABY0HC92_9PEZI|nr:hypothetical protein DL763_006788 [Monosporascus cannonballus]RYO87097.1 hypothetical protein DL762_004401 [Monosporascus cannonballus]RYP33248.1 hypothetical protein DL766_003553 [Monosporascus sp. MC13-8B]